MKRWRVGAEVTISLHTDVEAETIEEARAIAESRSIVGLCNRCSTGSPRHEWVASCGFDGEPVRLAAAERFGDD
jgi:hypothetical protein